MSEASRTALVTGGGGFIGSHLVDRLVEQGWSVRVLDDFSSGHESNLSHCLSSIELLRGDIRDRSLLKEVLRDVEVVFHEAAVPSVPRSLAEPERTNDVNVTGTLGLLEAARRAGVRRVVFAASSSAYGNTPELPKRESMPATPLSPYALQKYAGEQYCRLYSELFGLETVALRYFNVFGPRQDPNSQYAAVIPNFVTACLRGESPQVFGDGEQTRDFTFVADVARANLLAADAGRAAGAVVNVAGGARTSLNQLFAEIASITGATTGPVHAEARAGDVRDSLADLTLAGELLDYRPSVSLRDGLVRTVQYFREQIEGEGSA